MKKALFSNKGKAEEILNDANKWEKFKIKFEAFLHKAYDIPVLGTVIDDIISMYQLVESYIKREYTKRICQCVNIVEKETEIQYN